MDLQERQVNQAAELLKVLANPIRLKIMLLLSQWGPTPVKKIHEFLPVEQSLLSHHLIKMKDKGMAGSRRQGKESYYFIIDPSLGQALTLLLARDRNAPRDTKKKPASPEM